ncbi:MAG: nucleotidyltransferase domain-containing protein [Cyanobacteria bacterium P01_D01_bin.73]
MEQPDNQTLYLRLGVTPAQLSAFCRDAQISEFALFGSILRNDFRPDSDIDILVSFINPDTLSLIDFVDLEYRLENWLKRDVDLVHKMTVEEDRNWLRRQEILEKYQVIYESRPVLSS